MLYLQLEEGNKVNVEDMTKSTSERHGHKPEEVKEILEECLKEGNAIKS